MSLAPKKRDLLTLSDLSAEDFSSIFARSRDLKASPLSPVLKDKVLGMIFTKSSTRTRVSFEVGIAQLGGQTLFLSPHEIQLGRGETIEDTAKVLSRYLDGIIIRTHAHSDLDTFAKNASIPIINGLTNLSHPCQVLTDLFTILEKRGSYKDQKIVYLGDCQNNMSYSWMMGASLLGYHLVLTGDPDFQPRTVQLEKAASRASALGGSVEFIEDPFLAVAEADVLYADVWTSMGQETESATRIKHLGPWQINQKLLSHAKKDALFMHCLPAHRGEEVTDDVLDGTHSVVFDQAENRLHVQKAILTLICAS